jgi:hypothetical protein
MTARRASLLRLISDAMGKPVEPAGVISEGVAEPTESDEDLEDE